MTTGLSAEVLAAIRKAGVKRYFKQVLKVLAFWAVTITSLLIVADRNRFFNWEKQPISIGIAFAALVLFPIWKFKLLEPLLLPSYHGTVTKIENKVVIDGKDEDVKAWGVTKAAELVRVDQCTVVVTRENGRLDRFVCKREAASFARYYYQIGDPVYHPVFAKYPFNCSRKAARKFCIFCGGIGTSNETVCSGCGVPFAQLPDDPEDTGSV